jgi:carbonic anhydrase
MSYSVAQFHFHTPAEHRVNDDFYPMEMHWVFESEGISMLLLAFRMAMSSSRPATSRNQTASSVGSA